MRWNGSEGVITGVDPCSRLALAMVPAMEGAGL